MARRPGRGQPAATSLFTDRVDWIRAEVFVENLGYTWVPVPGEQWFIPYLQVRANWLTIARRLIDQAVAWA